MSPSENELRAALRQGEGDGVNAGPIIGRAEQARRHRRRTIGAVAGSVAAVAVIATAVPLVLNNVSDTNASSAGSAAMSAQSRGGPVGQVPGADEPTSTPNKAIIPTCPATSPTVALPVAPTTSPMFPDPIDRMLVCVFRGHGSSDLGTSYTLTGPEARTVADRLNALPANPANYPCPADLAGTVVLIGVAADGATREAVGNADGCGTTVSGTTWRNARELLRTLTNKGLPQQGSAPHASLGPGPS